MRKGNAQGLHIQKGQETIKLHHLSLHHDHRAPFRHFQPFHLIQGKMPNNFEVIIGRVIATILSLPQNSNTLKSALVFSIRNQKQPINYQYSNHSNYCIVCYCFEI